MASVDDRIVQMDFNNRSFESGVNTSLSTLQRLKNALTFGKTNGLDDVEKSASRLNLGPIADAADKINSHFNAMGIVVGTVISSITRRVLDMSINLGKAFTTDPIKAGFSNYETQINAIQTILANTAASGTTLPQVTASLKELNDYANLTVYNFSEMARNIGTFTAAGVDLKTSTAAIKGIANLAAFSGSSSEQASTAMYQLSQAISSGTVKLQDWNSVVNAGLGGKTFQNALIQTAKVHGTNVDAMIKKDGSFRNSLQEGWITSKVLTETLSQFTGDLSEKQLLSLGYSQKQAAAILKTGKLATDAATKIKTWTQLTSALKEEVASAYANIFKTIFGDINEATTLFTNAHNVIQNALTGPINNLNTLLEGTVKLGGRTKFFDALTNVVHAFSALVKPLKDAFREIFPATTPKQLMTIINIFDSLTRRLVIGSKTADDIKRTFAGFFAILHLGKELLKGVLIVIGDVLGTFLSGSGGVLNFTGNLGDMLVAFDKSVTSGGRLIKWFQNFGRELIVPIRFLGQIRDAIYQVFSNFTSSKNIDAATTALGAFGEKLRPLGDLLSNIKDHLSGLFGEFGNIGQTLKPAVDAVVNVFAQMGNSIAQAMSGGNFTGVLHVIQTGLLGGILLIVKKFFSKGLSVDIGGGFLGSIKETFEGLTGSMKAMQTQLKAKALLEIAGALALIVASVAVLATINSKKMADSLKALAIGFGELLAGVAVLTKVTGAAGIVKLPAMAAALILLSTAILTLTVAVKLMATMSWDEMKKGLTGVGLLLAGLSATALILSKSSASMISAGIGITAIAVAMNILFVAVKLFSTLSWKDMLKGLTGVIGSLVGIAGALHLMPKDLAVSAGQILIISAAILVLGRALKEIGNLSWEQIGKGLVGIAGALGAIVGALHLLPKDVEVSAGKILIISGALLVLGRALKEIGNLSWKVIGKGLTGIAGALGILAGALNLMEGTLPGAAAVLVVAHALGLLIPVLKTLATLKWGVIGKGIGALAAALGAIVAIGYLAEGAAVGLIALGVAMVGIGAGVALLGIGLKGIAEGIGFLIKNGAQGFSILSKAIDLFISKIPALAQSFAQGLINILKIIGANGPTIVKALGTILDSFLTVIINESPKLALAIEALVTALLKVIDDRAPDIIATGLRLLLSLLHGISDNIGPIVVAVAKIIVNFLNALANHITEIINAGANLLVKLLEGIADNLSKVIVAGADIIVHLITGIGQGFGDLARAMGTAIASFLSGIDDSVQTIITAGRILVIHFMQGISDSAVAIINGAFEAILTFLQGLDDAINHYESQIITECIKIGKDIIKGVIKGISDGMPGVGSFLKSGLSKAMNPITLLTGSPSKCIGEPIVEGIIDGIGNKIHDVGNSLKAGLGGTLEDVTKSLNKLPNPLDGIIDSSPVITPVLDLTNVQAGAKQIAALAASNVIPITAATSYVNAKNISSAVETEKQAQAATDAATTTPVPSLTLEQNNYSPEALSTVEIYRQTKNALSLMQQALGVPS